MSELLRGGLVFIGRVKRLLGLCCGLLPSQHGGVVMLELLGG